MLLNNGQSEEGSEEVEEGADQVEKKEEIEENTAGAEVIKFMTSKIDLSLLGQEFMCPVSSSRVGSGYHIIEDPLILTCCGATCCLECARTILSNPNCPFCHANFQQKEVTVLPNLPLQRLLKGGELIQITDKLDQSMKERI